jgi:RHS repeat-associated protein
MGGGVGGLLGTLRNPLNTSKVPVNPTTTLPATIRYNLSNGRGDIVAQSDGTGALTWTASYEAYGKRTKETGTNADKQRANTKDEDPTGLLNEGFRYRDIETGVWLSRDPAGFVDGPNLYAYVQQNPWTKFDPDGQFWSAIITAGFAAYDTYQYASGKTSGAEYAKAMALNGAAFLADVATAGNGGGLAVRAANATIKVAKAIDKADTVYSTVNGAIRTGEAIANGDGTGAVINGVLTAVGAKQMGGGGKAPDSPKVDAPGGKSAQATNTEAQQIAANGEGPFVPDEYWTRNAPANVTPGTRRIDHTKYNKTTKQLEESRVIYDDYGRQQYRVDKTDHGRPTGNGHPNDQGHTNPHLHESTYAPKGTQGHKQETGRKEVLHNLK